MLSEQDTFNRLCEVEIIEHWYDCTEAYEELSKFKRPFWNLCVKRDSSIFFEEVISYKMDIRDLDGYLAELRTRLSDPEAYIEHINVIRTNNTIEIRYA